MRRSFIAASALLVAAVLAGCSAPAPEPPEPPARPETNAAAAPTPEPPAETVDWTMPQDCADAAWPALLRSGEVIEPLENWTWMGQLPVALDAGLGCAAYVPNSDAGRSWGIARVAVADRAAALESVAQDGFEIVSDGAADGLRILTLEYFEEADVDELGPRMEQILVIGDAWFWAQGPAAFALEPLRWIADGLGLPIDVDWLLPLDCDEMAEAWPSLTDGGRSGEDALLSEGSSSSSLALFEAAQQTFISPTECGWAQDVSLTADRWKFDAELFSSVGRVDAAERDASIAALLAAGWEVAVDADGRTDLVLRGDRPAAAVFAGGGFISAEPLETAGLAQLEAFARGVGMLD